MDDRQMLRLSILYRLLRWLINMAGYQVHRRPILDGLTSEYHIAA
jgi:hypothetical protein